MKPGFWAYAVIILIGCSTDTPEKPELFTNVTGESGITFSNDLAITERLNPYTYRNFYNGAGVAIGDINNDGLMDIYFTGNQTDNKLYLNEGNMKFRDITDQAGVACAGVWCSGVTFADVNADGLLDIYVCKSGDPETANRANELFINNGDLTFREEASRYGLNVTGLSVQAAFFDYDKDSDLDCYLLTNSIRSVGNYDLIKDQRSIPDPQGGGNKFFINDNGKFVDYSEKAGIFRSNIGFGLGITLGDFNNDSWADIFISNDFFERDYLYINNQKGAFKESLPDYFESISMGSMGADLGDLDGDGVPELFVTEMLPESLTRKKTKTVFENWDKYQLNVQNGYYHQFSRNVLQKRIGDGNYAEVGRMSGIAASEWSWGALLFDMDNDGKKDIFIANGIYKDLLDRDYLTYTAAEENIRKMVSEKRNAITELIDLMPSSAVPNYAYRNDGNLRFTNVATEWGLGKPMFSSGSAYGDLDNDGDLDLVVNNLNAPSAVYRNNSDVTKFAGMGLSLSSHGKNTQAVGARVTAYAGGHTHFADNYVTRGFQSSVQSKIHIGLGQGVSSIDSMRIEWSDRGDTMLYKVAVSANMAVKQTTNRQVATAKAKATPWKLTRLQKTLFEHKGSGLIDFNRDRLLPMMYSNETPSLLKGDIDNNGTEDVYVGGGKDQPGTFILNERDVFKKYIPESMNSFSLAEETSGALFDVDGDGDLDVYMASGGRFFPNTSTVLSDQVFLNDGKGKFSESPDPLPFTSFVSTSVAVPIDFDKDGDQDLVIGERFDPFVYGLGGRGYVFSNDGKGKFTDVTQAVAPQLSNIGMITDAIVEDIDGDQWPDVILVGDWMPIVMLRNTNGKFSDISAQMGLSGTEGWWHAVEGGDLNKDGKPDFVFANHGLNTFFNAGDRMYVSDFDKSGSVEQIFCTGTGGKYFPVADRDEFVSQMPSMKKVLLYYKDYGMKSIDELFPPAVLEKSRMFQVNTLASMALISGAGGYQRVELPAEAQYSPLYGLLLTDLDKDGVLDLLAGGNQYSVKPQFGRYDASSGWFFKGRLDEGKFSFLPGRDLDIKGQIRDIEYVESNGKGYLLFAKYDSELEIYKVP
jgi:hypothetical protein